MQLYKVSQWEVIGSEWKDLAQFNAFILNGQQVCLISIQYCESTNITHAHTQAIQEVMGYTS